MPPRARKLLEGAGVHPWVLRVWQSGRADLHAIRYVWTLRDLLAAVDCLEAEAIIEEAANKANRK